MDKQQLGIIAVFAVGAWVAWLIFVAARQYMAARMQAAAQDKILARLSSPENLQVFLSSETGSRFLRSLEQDPREVWHGIIRGTQTAVVCGFLGASLLVCHLIYREVEGLLPFGLGAMVMAVAFGLSAVVSVTMHRRAGLLPRDGE